jgi:lysophospholipase L1-like esterase
VFGRHLKSSWALLGVAPLFLLLRDGLVFSVVLSSLTFAIGWLLLTAAVRRDPEGRVLREFAATRPARIAGAGILVMVLAAIAADRGRATVLLVLSAGAVLFGLWAWSPTGERLARMVSRISIAFGSFATVALAGEFVFRLPAVVARTGGGTPGLTRWNETRYDRLWERNLIRRRSFHLEEPKGEETFRIVTLGDSFTWGEKIARTEDVWPYVLERGLRESGRPVEVVNLAWGGYTTVNEAEVLRRMGWVFQPDLLVLQYFLNDTLPSGPGLQCKGEGWFFRTRPLLPAFLHHSLDYSSYFYSFVDQGFEALQRRLLYPDGLAPLFRDDFPGWQASQAALREMEEEARGRHVPMLVVLFPSFVPGRLDRDSYPFGEIHRKIEAAVAAAGLPFLDLLQVYAACGREGRTWHALPNDPHPNEEGHRVAGKAVGERLAELGFLPPPRR